MRPVVYFSLNDVKKLSWDECYQTLEGKIAAEYQRHGYLADSAALSEIERAQFGRVLRKEGVYDDVASSLRQLTLYLRKHHNRNVVVLIDEYDAPIMAAHTYGYYREAVGFIKGWRTGALKDGGAALEFACLTGVQRIAKESIFSDLNNIAVDTPLDTESDERFGFTRGEVAALADYLGHPHRYGEVREWYDGYRFGDADIYNPWSVLNYFSKRCRPDVYWANTASNAVVADAVRASNGAGFRDVCRLLQPGGTIARPLDMEVVFPESGATGDILWSMLYLAGYLTTDDIESPGDRYRVRRLRIPNKEIAQVFRGEVIERFREVAGGAGRLLELHEVLVAGDAAVVEAELARILATSPSVRDLVRENSYHMLMTGLLFGVPGYGDPRSNREEGRGYYDLRIAPEGQYGQPVPEDLPVVTVELKVLGRSDAPHDGEALAARLAEVAREGLDQINRQRYDCEAPGGCLRYGVAFCGKDVAVACARG